MKPSFQQLAFEFQRPRPTQRHHSSKTHPYFWSKNPYSCGYLGKEQERKDERKNASIHSSTRKPASFPTLGRYCAIVAWAALETTNHTSSVVQKINCLNERLNFVIPLIFHTSIMCFIVFSLSEPAILSAVSLVCLHLTEPWDPHLPSVSSWRTKCGSKE